MPSDFTKTFTDIKDVLVKHAGVTDFVNTLRDYWLNAHAEVNNKLDLNSSTGEAVANLAMMSTGAAFPGRRIEAFCTGIDKYHAAKMDPHLEIAGPTFITRPRLCLTSDNLRLNPRMAPLDTSNPKSLATAIRFWLDSHLPYVDETQLGRKHGYADIAKACPLFNIYSPWLLPLCNSIISVIGFNDVHLEVERMPGGYFEEVQAFAQGADDGNSGGDITIEFREMPGEMISAIIYYWIEYIRCVTRGSMLAYPDDIIGQILNYTVSIYVFNLDVTRQHITRWAKLTGCFPISIDMGSLMERRFNDATSGDYVDANKVSVKFVCNKFEYMNPSSLMDFNILAKRYYKDITDDNSWVVPHSAFSNFYGMPYIVNHYGNATIQYRATNDLISYCARNIINSMTDNDLLTQQKIWGDQKFTDYLNTNGYSPVDVSPIGNHDPYKWMENILDMLKNRNNNN